jgi:hypothetical protein
MLEALINHSDDLRKLQAECFVMEVCDGWLIIHHIPYVNAMREIKEGILTMVLCTSGQKTAKPNDHTAQWVGEWPCDITGKQLPSLVNPHLRLGSCPRYVPNYYLSCHAESKEYPPNGEYPTYYEKVETYFGMIAGPALSLDKGAWSKINKPILIPSMDSPLKYMDTNASKAGISELNDKFLNLKIAIIGLGGTGSYLLDFVSKTKVQEIHIFDADVFNTHNVFRSPSVPSEEELTAAPYKVEYFSSIYSRMHGGIVPHCEMVTENNLNELDGMNYVFLSIDKVAPKKMIADYLVSHGIPFIDSGMGVDKQEDGKLSGLLHVTIGTSLKYNHLSDVLGDEKADDDLYASDIQISELNALAAALSVIKWKKMLGYYADTENEYLSLYGINDNEIINKNESERI